MMTGRHQSNVDASQAESVGHLDKGVCIVTQPERTGTGKDHVHDLADIIAQITSITILTANLPEDASLREEYTVETYSKHGTGESLIREIIRFIRNQFRLCFAIRRRPEEIVLFFGATSYVLPVLCARLTGKRVVILPRGDVPRSLRLRWETRVPDVVAGVLAGLVGALERINYRLAHGIVTYTPSMAAELGLDRYESKLFTNGARFIDTDQFDVRVPVEDRQQTIGYVGRFDVEKRLPLMVDVAEELAGDYSFVFVGDGDYRETLEERLAEHIDNGDVTVTGWVDRDELPEYYNEMRLLVVPSEPTEGLPTVILEAMACGTPVCATPVSGVPDIIVPRETGCLLEDEDPQAMAADIRRMMTGDEIGMLGRNARALIEEKYAYESAVRRYTDILRSV